MTDGYSAIHSVDEWGQTEGMKSKRFRSAFIIKPAKLDFSPLLEDCENLLYVTDGVGDHVDNIREQVERSLRDFDAKRDVIIPVGSAYVAFLSGQILRQKIYERSDWDSFAMGVFLNGSYYFWRIYVDPSRDSEKVE